MKRVRLDRSGRTLVQTAREGQHTKARDLIGQRLRSEFNVAHRKKPPTPSSGGSCPMGSGARSAFFGL